MEKNGNLTDLFKQNAQAVSAHVKKIKSVSDAIDYGAALVNKDERPEKTVAAPQFTASQIEGLKEKCPGAGIVQTNLSQCSSGVGVAFTTAEYGIAATGTLVIDSKDVEKRLATMIGDIHVAILPESKIVAASRDLVPQMNEMLSQSSGYLAFVTGASRTADIERVLVVGVHGPLELHILVVEDA